MNPGESLFSRDYVDEMVGGWVGACVFSTLAPTALTG